MSSHSYDLIKFKDNLLQLQIHLSEYQFDQFVHYYELLTEWNQVMNLTAITEFEEVCTKHFIDSLSISTLFPNDIPPFPKEYTLIDIGTGAGFPGIALKIAFPQLRITLLDSLKKRITYLNEVVGQLQLEDVETIHGRAEDFAKETLLREKFDLCVSRAVANLSTLSEYCLPYVKIGGYFIAYKSERAEEEIAMSTKAIELLGAVICKQKEFVLPSSDIHRTLLVIQKVKETPKKYPRKAGLPSKEPL